MKRKYKICNMSAGASSFIAGWLVRDTIDEWIYIDIDDQHPDSMRFVHDCEKLIGKPITVIRSSEYHTVEQCAKTAGIFKNVRSGYAPCTAWMKKRVRKQWEMEHPDLDITYVWGYDYGERHRVDRMLETDPEHEHEFPLVDKMLAKEDVHAMLEELGIERPMMYRLGYPNNNCIGCVKGGMGYWNKIRVDFPEVFNSRAKLERELGCRILKECYLDELDPNRGNMDMEIFPDCSVMCRLTEI